MFLAKAAQRIQILQPRHRFVPLDAVERLLLGEHMNVPHQAELRQYIDQGGARAAKFQLADTHPSPGFWRRLRGRQDNDLLLVRLIGLSLSADGARLRLPLPRQMTRRSASSGWAARRRLDRLTALKATVPGEMARCMELFQGIQVADTRECLLSALRRLSDPEAVKKPESPLRPPPNECSSRSQNRGSRRFVFGLPTAVSRNANG